MVDAPFRPAAEWPHAASTSLPSNHALNRALVQHAAFVRNMIVVAHTRAYFTVSDGSREVRFWGYTPEPTTCLAGLIVSNRALRVLLLARAGLSVPASRAFAERARPDAWRYAQELGLPVTVRAEGSVNTISTTVTEQEFNVAWEAVTAAAASRVTVEKSLAGNDYQLFVVGNRLVAAIRRDQDRVEDVTERMHPDFHEIAVRAAGVTPGALTVGVDLRVGDISLPAVAQDWWVTGLESRPVLVPHHFPTAGTPRDVAGALLEELFPASTVCPESERVCVHVIITGRVTGVMFRSWLRRRADLRGLTGWVRNREDGAVEAVFCGAPRAVDDLASLCRSGPSRARVDAASFEPVREAPSNGFQIRT